MSRELTVTRGFLPWIVLHLPLREALPDLDAEPDIGGLFIVFWYDGTPLGQLMIPAALLPIGSAQLAATAAAVIAPALSHRIPGSSFELAANGHVARPICGNRLDLARLVDLKQPLRTLARAVNSELPDAPHPSVSIVVCTRNRPESLDRCLRSIHALSPAANEVVVVDNDPASGMTRSVTERFSQTHYLPEPRPGLSIARNSGLLNCSGTIVAFTDDDVVAHPGWIAAVRATFLDPGVIAMTGLVLPAALATQAEHVFQTDTLGWEWGYQEMDFDETFFDSTRHLGVPAWRLGAGANMAFRRAAFDRVGLFDERLGAGAAGCSEDSEVWYRLLAQGHRCHYSPSAVVFHHHRSDWEGFREQLRSYMRGHVAALLFQFERHGHWGNVYRACVALPWYLMKLAFRSSKQQVGRLVYDPTTDVLSAPVVPQILGALAGYGYYLRHRAGRDDAIPQIERRATETP